MFKIRGLNDVIKELRALRNAEQLVQEELQKIADAIMQGAVSRVHVLSGHLKSTAYVNAVEGGYAVGFSASYAAYEEFGTGPYTEVPNGLDEFAMEFFVSGKGHSPAHPYLLPAFFEERDKAIVTLEEAIRKHFNLQR